MGCAQFLIPNYKNHPFFFAAAFFAGDVFLAGRLLPNEPWKRLPFAVFLSPLPIIYLLILLKTKIKLFTLKKRLS
jgi:hypothetical protein